MNTQFDDPRLARADLEAAVDFAYGGGAIRAGRKAQARTLAALFRGKSKAAQRAARASTHAA